MLWFAKDNIVLINLNLKNKPVLAEVPRGRVDVWCNETSADRERRREAKRRGWEAETTQREIP